MELKPDSFPQKGKKHAVHRNPPKPVKPGKNQTLKASRLLDVDSFPQARVGRRISASLFTDEDRFDQPAVTHLDGQAVTFLFDDADTIFSATITTRVGLAPDVFQDADEFPSAQIGRGVLPAMLDDADTFFAPSVSTSYNLAPALLACCVSGGSRQASVGQF